MIRSCRDRETRKLLQRQQEVSGDRTVGQSPAGAAGCGHLVERPQVARFTAGGSQRGSKGTIQHALALALRVPANRIGAIIKGRRSITADTALRLARYFGTSAQLWMNLQAQYDLAETEDALRHRIEREVLPRSAA